MSEWQNVVTIDGPSGVGKSTISRRIADSLGFTYLDTGAMYRAVGLYLERNEIDISDDLAVRAALEQIQIRLFPGETGDGETGVLLNGEDVSRIIRSPEMAMIASRVSAVPVIREKLTLLQREIGREGRVVAEGRDTGTVVFPLAKHKFFLDAKPEERAHRRVLQLSARGEKVDQERILAMILERDKNDRERAIAPLRQAEDALAIDTTNKDLDEVTRLVLRAVSEKDRPEN
jgi:cytidylate kinase